MDYKTFDISDNSFELGKDLQEDFFVKDNIKMIDYEKFSDFLDLMICCDKIDIENNTTSLIKRFRKYIIQFYENKQEFTEFGLFRKKKIIEFLIDHASLKYTIKVRKASLKSIATFLALYPQFSDVFIHFDFILILNDVFNNYINEKNKALLAPAYKILGNLIHNLETVTFEINLFNIIKEIKIIDFVGFINSTSVFETSNCKGYKCINYAISCIFRQSSNVLTDDSMCFLLPEEQVVQMLTILNRTICSKINEETCSNNLHLYALSAIDLFVKSEKYDKNFRRIAIIQSQIHNTINRYFEVEIGLIREKCMVLSIISTFYKLEIPDIYRLIESIIPFLLFVVQTQETGGPDVYQEAGWNGVYQEQNMENTNKAINPKHTQRCKNIRRICDAIKEILESPYCPAALDYFYSFDALNYLYKSLDDTKKIMEKLFIIGVIAFFAEVNSKYLPLNDFFFSEKCIEIFLILLDGENDDFNLQVLKAILIIFDAAIANGQFDQVIEIFMNYDGIDTIKNLKDSEDNYVLAYVTLILEKIEPFSAE